MKKLLTKIIAGRQATANARIAHLLQQSEFKNESYDHVLHMVNTGTIHDRLG